jgi:hypothetical protein
VLYAIVTQLGNLLPPSVVLLGEALSTLQPAIAMTQPNVIDQPDASLAVLDDRGTLLGTIRRPLSPDPLGPGRETVYMAPRRRAEQSAA